MRRKSQISARYRQNCQYCQYCQYCQCRQYRQYRQNVYPFAKRSRASAPASRVETRKIQFPLIQLNS